MEIKRDKYKLVLFDMDLTLMDSRESARLCYEAAHKAVGDIFKEEDLLRFLGVPLDTSYDEIKGEKGSFKTYCDVFEQNARKTIVEYSSFYEDGLKLIENLSNNNIKVGILSNRSNYALNSLINKSEVLKKYISVIISCDDVVRTKPDPEPFYCAIKKTGLNKEDILYIGDAKNDWLACKAAVVDFICVNRYGMCDFDCKQVKSLSEIKIV